MSKTDISRISTSGKMRVREHLNKNLSLPTIFGYREIRGWKMVICVILLSFLITVEAASLPALQPESSAVGFKASGLGSSSSVVERAVPIDPKPVQEAKPKLDNGTTSIQAGEPEKKVQDATPEKGITEDTETSEVTENKAEKKSETPLKVTEEDEIDAATNEDEAHMPMAGLKGLSYDAILRGFYVFVGIGTIVLLYIVIKLIRLRRRRATRKYRVLSQHVDDQEMFPLAADDGDDEEIYNAADHHTVK